MKILYWVLLAILLFFILAIAVILFSPVKIEYDFKKENGGKLKSKLNLSVINGIIKLNLPDLNIKAKSNKKDKRKKKKNAEQLQSKQSDEQFKSVADDLFKLLKKLTAKDGKRRAKKIVAEDIVFYLKFGLFDAAQTGIATGAIWTLLYGFFAFFEYRVTVKSHDFKVVPVFETSFFEFNASGIIKAKTVNIIGMVLKIYRNYKKVKKEGA